MRAIRSKDTRPELVVRSLAHTLGYRFRLHKPGLPGKPDLVFNSRKKIVFVHGCFWHQHGGRCGNSHRPKVNSSYWEPKLDRTVARDAANYAALKTMGWDVMVVWECEITDPAKLKTRLQRFLGKPR